MFMDRKNDGLTRLSVPRWLFNYNKNISYFNIIIYTHIYISLYHWNVWTSHSTKILIQIYLWTYYRWPVMKYWAKSQPSSTMKLIWSDSANSPRLLSNSSTNKRYKLYIYTYIVLYCYFGQHQIDGRKGKGKEDCIVMIIPKNNKPYGLRY